MNYNYTMTTLLAALLLLAGPARAADPKADAASAAVVPADKETIDIVNYFLKVELADASPKLIDPVLSIKIETLPKKLQTKAAAKQTEIRTLLKLHDTEEERDLRPAAAEGCSEKELREAAVACRAFSPPGYEVVTEDDLKYVMDKTKCTEIDLGCRFTLKIFFEKKKDARRQCSTRTIRSWPSSPASTAGPAPRTSSAWATAACTDGQRFSTTKAPPIPPPAQAASIP